VSSSASSPADGGVDGVFARVVIVCNGAAGTSFTLHHDDAFLGVGLTPVELQSFDVE
jgi:hypothetical protein